MISAKVGHSLDSFLLKVYSAIFKKKHINPNNFTICGLVFGIVTASSIALGYLLTGAFFLFLSGFFDLMDGAVARNTARLQSTADFWILSRTDILTC
jgi:hypothetical protein